MWQGTPEGLWPTAREQVRPLASKTLRNRILPTTTGVNLEGNPSPSRALK